MKNSPGLSESDAKKVSSELAKVLGDTFALYLKTHGFHWNVEGPNFHELHLLLETQYNEIWKALDELAERIRALGNYAPGSTAEMMKLTVLSEEKGVPSPVKMLQLLVEDHDTICTRLNAAHKVADDLEDSGTTSMLEERLIAHQEMAWMLRSYLKDVSGDYVVKSVEQSLKSA